MDFVSKYQGVVGRVFGNENSSSNEDSYVERLLERISNGVLTEDRRTAMVELQSVVAESNAAQMAFGAMVWDGFRIEVSVMLNACWNAQVMVSSLRTGGLRWLSFNQLWQKIMLHRWHLGQWVRGALETLVSALKPVEHTKPSKNEVQPALMNSDILSREVDNISLLLSLLSEEDFYIQYYTLQLLTDLLTNSLNRLQEAILTIPCGITRLMDMLMDREVIRNEALLLLTYLTREAEEIQKIVVFEGAFEKIFSIIREEGGSEGGGVVQILFINPSMDFMTVPLWTYGPFLPHCCLCGFANTS